MPDVAIDVSVLRAASRDIVAAARSLPVTVEPSPASESGFGCDAVVAVLDQVGAEQLIRAEVAGEGLAAAGGRPASAAATFSALDRGILSAR